MDRLAPATDSRQGTTRLAPRHLQPNLTLANQLAFSSGRPTEPLRMQLVQKTFGTGSIDRVAKATTQVRSTPDPARLFKPDSNPPYGTRILSQA